MDLFKNILKDTNNLPSYVSAYGWIPFVIVILLTFVFSALFVRHFWCRYERDRCAAVASTIGLTIALLASFLLPLDVFLVSYMKNPDGSFKEWATNSTRESLEHTVTNTYYSLYGIIFFYSFLVLPFVYFCYEEKDDDQGNAVNVVPAAIAYTLVFLLVVSALLLAGAFIRFKAPPPQNSTQWDKIEFIVLELAENRGADAVAFTVNVLTIYGMLNLILYTSIGMATFPINLIKGFRSLSDEEVVLSENQAANEAKINALKSKQSTRSLSSREVAALSDLEEEESLISRRALLLETEKKSIFHKCGPFLRIFSAIGGCIGIIFSLIFCSSLLLANIDRLMHSLGYKMGYALKENYIQNPLDFIMVEAQKVFPLDYILFFFNILFLVMSTVSGMRYLGVCCLCIPMYKVRPSRTPPQGLIMLCFILMFCILAFHILVYFVVPTYTVFGSQYYCEVNNGTSCDLKACTLNAPSEDCVMTRGATFILTFAYKAWIFAATYFWMTWVFLAGFLFGLIMTVVRSKRSVLEEAIDRDDFDDSFDDRMLRA
ncbi:putative lysosomal cobalamin transporter, partial [Stegodyphus mimosarum]